MLGRTSRMMLMYCLFLLPALCLVYISQKGEATGGIPIQILQRWMSNQQWWGSLYSRVQSAENIVGLQPPVSDPVPVGGVWEGISQTNSPPSSSGWLSFNAEDSMEKKHLKSLNSMQAKASYTVETGQGDMPPVEQTIASWTAVDSNFTFV